MNTVALVALIGVVNAFAPDARTDLSGQVIDERGQPIADAAVYIHTAHARSGSSAHSAAAELDCRKKRSTDVEGRFVVRGLDSDYRFDVLVVGKEHRPTIIEKVDPQAGELRVTLPVSIPLPDPQHVVKGRVVDARGEPVVGARIETIGGTSAGQRWWAPLTDHSAISDSDGQFAINTREDLTTIDVRVRAPRMATQNFPLLSPGRDVQDLAMHEGTNLKGRVLKEGQPAANVTISVVQSRRGVEHFLGDSTAVTDASGEFFVSSLPSREAMNVYAKMNKATPGGAISIKPFTTGEEASTLDVGTLQVVPARRVAGKVTTSDNTPIPDGTRLQLTRDDAWDNVTLHLPRDGTFEFQGLPQDVICLFVQVPGYRFTEANVSLERVNNRIKGIVTSDLANLILALEPGEAWDTQQVPDEVQKQWWDRFKTLRTTPLQGAPPQAAKPDNGS